MGDLGASTQHLRQSGIWNGLPSGRTLQAVILMTKQGEEEWCVTKMRAGMANMHSRGAFQKEVIKLVFI